MFPKPEKASPVYEGRREVDKYEELDELISDPDEMRMQVSSVLNPSIANKCMCTYVQFLSNFN